MKKKEKKFLEREKYKLLRKSSTRLERLNVKKNIDLFLDNYKKKNIVNGNIAIYWPLENEVDLRDLKKEYPLALPKCLNKNELKFYKWDNKPLKNDFKGIPSPTNSHLLDHKEISIIFTPCLSVDKRLTRLGYGGGYFDKLRSKKCWEDILCIGVLTEKCVSKELLVRENFDIPLSGYITDKEILV